jgi:hypothetical protein
MFRSVQFEKPSPKPQDGREGMIEQTNAFLTWALTGDRDLPRIPRCKVSEGGFAVFLRHPRARTAFARWWSTTLGFDEPRQ